jgi:hypothetical protein
MEVWSNIDIDCELPKIVRLSYCQNFLTNSEFLETTTLNVHNFITNAHFLFPHKVEKQIVWINAETQFLFQNMSHLSEKIILGMKSEFLNEDKFPDLNSGLSARINIVLEKMAMAFNTININLACMAGYASPFFQNWDSVWNEINSRVEHKYEIPISNSDCFKTTDGLAVVTSIPVVPKQSSNRIFLLPDKLLKHRKELFCQNQNEIMSVSETSFDTNETTYLTLLKDTACREELCHIPTHSQNCEQLSLDMLTLTLQVDCASCKTNDKGVDYEDSWIDLVYANLMSCEQILSI